MSVKDSEVFGWLILSWARCERILLSPSFLCFREELGLPKGDYVVLWISESPFSLSWRPSELSICMTRNLKGVIAGNRTGISQISRHNRPARVFWFGLCTSSLCVSGFSPTVLKIFVLNIAYMKEGMHPGPTPHTPTSYISCCSTKCSHRGHFVALLQYFAKLFVLHSRGCSRFFPLSFILTDEVKKQILSINFNNGNNYIVITN